MDYKVIVLSVSSAVAAVCLWQNVRLSARTEQVMAAQAGVASDCRRLQVEIVRCRESRPVDRPLAPEVARIAACLKRIEFVDESKPLRADEVAKKEADSIAGQEQKARGYRSHLATQYAPFYYQAGLSNEQIDRLEMMLTDHWQSMADIRAVAESRRLADGDPVLKELRAKADQTLQEAEIALLGQEGFVKLDDYKRSLPARDFAATVAVNLYQTETPLTTAQAWGLPGC